jgi:hypothetical protein
VRSLLALVAVHLGTLAPVSGVLPTFGITATSEEFRAAAMDVAQELVEER